MDVSFLTLIDQFNTLITAIIAVFHLAYFKRASSVAIVAYVFLVLQAVSITITPVITGHISTVSVEIGRLVFYFTFAFAYLVGLIAISKAHRQYSAEVSGCARFTSYAFAFLAVFFVVRYFDRSLGLDWLGHFHKYIIPVMDLSVVIMLCHGTAAQIWRNAGMNGVKGV